MKCVIKERKYSSIRVTYLTKDLIEKMAFEPRLEGGERFRQWLSEHASQRNQPAAAERKGRM